MKELRKRLKQPEVLIGRSHRFGVVELDEEIEIAGLLVEALFAGGGAKHIQPPHGVRAAKRFQFGPTVFQQRRRERRGDRQIVLSPRGIKDTGLVEGDKWLFKIATQARQAGFPVILDRGEGLFPPDYPMRHAAFYFGWYTGDVSGPMARPGFKFTQGAVAVHIHSFSAASMRDPKRSWCAPLLAAGAALSSVAPTSKSAVSRRERTSDLEVGATGDRSASTPRIVS